MNNNWRWIIGDVKQYGITSSLYISNRWRQVSFFKDALKEWKISFLDKCCFYIRALEAYISKASFVWVSKCVSNYLNIFCNRFLCLKANLIGKLDWGKIEPKQFYSYNFVFLSKWDSSHSTSFWIQISFESISYWLGWMYCLFKSTSKQILPSKLQWTYFRLHWFT